ncbi:M20/M25/M40 family metallo-hydrolase [Dokdonella sp.]|uniref:M20/M25/M40 family metallo-hydrolase n=1 Tax=Dokdonella sp. TaxID=2291710 RepID=UPI001B0FE171|nr:M20/M25/M40 family metallo-hydrolase [Dokdonella sp.]MBO9664019.1 M20/M25/M40 family metallo-hydrolase [Dokdonella sp.]
MNLARLLLAAAVVSATPLASAQTSMDHHADPSIRLAADDSSYVVMSRRTFDGARPSTRDATMWIDHLGRDLVVAQLDRAQIGVVSRYVHENERRCGGFFAFGSRPEAEAFVARDRASDALARPQGVVYTIDNQVTVDAWLPQVAEANIRASIASLSAFRNRYYASTYGRQAAESIRDSWVALAGSRSDASVELFEDCAECSTQPSVIMTVQGAELPDEVVVVGGHLDSINWSTGNPGPNDLAPGADDDASGIATITEIIRIAMASGWQPKRTVKFMGYAAEEVGLYGSNSIATRFRADDVNVVGVLQLDMTNYKTDAPYDLQIISDNSDAALLTYFAELFDAYLAPLGLVRSPLACGYGCSDHASWTEAGYPAGMVFEAGRTRDPNNPFDLGDFPYIHSSGDTLANMDDSAIHSVKFAQFGLAFIGELAKTHAAEPDDRIFADGFEP